MQKEAPDTLTIYSELESILASKVFIKSTILSNFLRYVVTKASNGEFNEIKEYSIAVKALGKASDFNPQTDAMIRIHASRLRRYLVEYYNGEGNGDSLIISLNKGSYVPEFSWATEFQKQQKSASSLPASRIYNRAAVLPFKNLTGRSENDYIIDGFCEQLSSDLAQFPEIAVIAYYSAAKYRGEQTDIRDIGKSLNASHLITGSIFRDDKHLRISIQLVNAVTGAQLWTQTYDKAVQSEYLLEIFDDIIRQVVPKLSGYYGLISMNSFFSSQIDPSLSLETVDAVFWYHHFQVIHTENAFRNAMRNIEQALKINPSYALGWAILAELYIDGVAYFYPVSGDPLQEANKCLQKALQLDPNCQQAYSSLTWMYIFTREKNKAVESLEHCISINPRSSFFLGGGSFLFALLGEYEKSMHYFKLSNDLNPHCSWWVNLGPIFTSFYNADYEMALAYAERIHIPGVVWNAVFKIAALGQLGRRDEAKILVTDFDEKFPNKGSAILSVLKSILFHDVVYERVKEGLLISGITIN